MATEQSTQNDLNRRLAECQQAHRADNLRLVDARQEQVNRAIAAESRVRELEGLLRDARREYAAFGTLSGETLVKMDKASR